MSTVIHSTSTSTSLLMKIVSSLDELLEYWDGLLEVAPEIKDCVPLITSCLANGMVGIIGTDQMLHGLVVVEIENDATAMIHMMPKTVGRACVGFIREWAVSNGISALYIKGQANNGSSFRFFEKTLGFHRSAVIFKMTIWPGKL